MFTVGYGSGGNYFDFDFRNRRVGSANGPRVWDCQLRCGRYDRRSVHDRSERDFRWNGTGQLFINTAPFELKGRLIAKGWQSIAYNQNKAGWEAWTTNYFSLQNLTIEQVQDMLDAEE